MLGIIFFASFAALILLGSPIAFAMAIATLLALSSGSFALTIVPQRMFAGMDSFPLLAIPLFIMAGGLMETGGISIRLVRLATALVGHIRGGLGLVTVLSTMLFSGISGASSADTAAIGSILIPAMEKRGFGRERATAIVAASGGMGILVPPCIAMVVLAVVADLSVGTLFLAGFVPGALMGLTLMGVISLQARRLNLPVEPRASCGELAMVSADSLLALLMPVIIMGGILGGIFTATEAAVVAVVYGLVVGGLVYREITPRKLWDTLVTTATISGAIALLVGAASVLAWILANERIPQGIAAWMFSLSKEPWVFLLLANLLLLFVGALLEGAPAIILLIPLLLPTATKLGINPIHFAIVTIANLGVGFILPPVGLCFLVACGVGKASVAGVGRVMWPYLAIMIATLLVITYVPWFCPNC